MVDGYEPMDSKTLEIELSAAFARIERGEVSNPEPENPKTPPQRIIIYSAFEPPQRIENRALEESLKPLSPENCYSDFSEYISDSCI